MFHYIDQPRTPSFPIDLVKTESNVIVRLVDTCLGRLTLVVAIISVDAYPFLAFLDLTCHFEDTAIGIFWLHCRLIVRRLNLELATKRLLCQQVKIPGLFYCHVAHGSLSLQLLGRHIYSVFIQIYKKFIYNISSELQKQKSMATGIVEKSCVALFPLWSLRKNYISKMKKNNTKRKR